MLHPESMRAGARELLVAGAVLGAATCLAFGPALSGQFLTWDDDRFVDHDPAVQALTLANVGRIFTTIYAEVYLPLHRLANAVDLALWGRNPAGFHATSLLLWTLALVAVVALFRELGAGRWGALAGVLVIGIHPLQAEPVAWISAKKDLLALIFFASAATVALGAPALRSRRMVGALGLYALALLSKATVVVLPAFLVMADVMLRGRAIREALRRAAPFALLALAAALPVVVLWTDAHLVRSAPETGLSGRVAWVGLTMLHHAGKMLWPTRLSILYPSDDAPTLDGPALAGLAMLAACLAAPWWPRLGRARFGVAWIGVALLPVSNLVPLTFFLADRYASLPLLGIGWLVALGVDEAWRREPRRAGPVAVCAAIAVAFALGTASRARAAEFGSDERLLRAAVAAQPRSYFARMKLGEILRETGDLRGSIRQYEAAIRLDPERALAHGGLFLAVARTEARHKHLDRARADRALPLYMRALDDPQALLAVTTELRRQGLPETALLPLDRALALDPWPDARLRAEAARALQAGDRRAALLLLRRVQAPDRAVQEALQALSPPAR